MTFRLVDEQCEAGRLHGCPRWLIMQCNEKRFLPSLPDPPASRRFPPVHSLTWETFTEQGV